MRKKSKPMGRPRKVDAKTIKAMKALRKQGLKYHQIACQFDVTPMTVWNRLNS